MKSYTDLEQSKKLAEILPLESADMFWLVLGNTTRVHVLTEPFSNYSHWESYPSWSLTALLDALPDESDIVKGKVDVVDDKYMCTTCVKEEIITTFGNNPIDACVALIEKLHELKHL